MIRALVADDEPAIRGALTATISAAPGFEVVATCVDGDDALRQIQALQPDVAFLDIKMPHRSGLDVVEALPPAERPLVVFVTAFDEHAISAFDVRAVDFLVKPYARSRLLETLERLRERCATIEHGQSTEVPGIVAIARGRRMVVPYDEIRWIEAAGSYARLHTTSGTAVLVRIPLNHLADQLSDRSFIRIHRSSIVSIGCIRSVAPTGSGDGQVVLDDDTVVKASRTYGAALRRALQIAKRR